MKTGLDVFVNGTGGCPLVPRGPGFRVADCSVVVSLVAEERAAAEGVAMVMSPLTSEAA